VATPAVGATPTASGLDAAAQRFEGTLTKADVDRVVQNPGGGVPQDIDRLLLRAGAGTVATGSLTQDEKRELRKAFIKACKARP
jgi:hypothetical protein